MEAVLNLTKSEEKNLNRYAQILKKYISPEIMRYLPAIGCRQRPKSRRLEAERIAIERDELQKKLGIGWKYHSGLWRLEMVGANETPGSSYCDSGFWWIFPLKSDMKNYLNFLAEQSLPRFFHNESFRVESTLLPCNGDISWDCR